MKVKLKSINLEVEKEDLENYSKLEFARLVEGSFNEWTRLEEEKEKINWSGEFKIESEDDLVMVTKSGMLIV